MAEDPEVLRYSAFAATAEGGNPAGVVLDASRLDDAAMQRIAAEVGYSETAFVVGQDADEPTYRVRFWSPAAEVPFCGHATVATAVALAERDGPGHVAFETLGGRVELRSATDETGTVTVSFTSVDPEVRDIDDEVRDGLLALLGLTGADLDPRFPVREAYAGNWHPIVVIAERDLFHQFRFLPADVAAIMRELGWLGTVTVLHELRPGVFEARNLFPVGRITEDPATGSAAASTGAYLREHGYLERTIRIEQGRHVGRPSALVVTIPDSGGIEVTGGATRIR
ncbi:PhzF family phenazine biosynthesis isomerase [Microbacterium sp. YMB-B2]|uniref:PhzF family phenazine biosynthesis isomerase n=1 Tax=Microbacterium tenebrionis TaxID=2830665 RepID=A0A9X1LPH4_9MICO|nr:PhzF family phenazine biosynthesis isomerase [Microbacterium tenebrionis]MCC2029539.1 PhzF family phenazine biosynthesis isomerase [Microbacterium tenebrionis]